MILANSASEMTTGSTTPSWPHGNATAVVSIPCTALSALLLGSPYVSCCQLSPKCKPSQALLCPESIRVSSCASNAELSGMILCLFMNTVQSLPSVEAGPRQCCDPSRHAHGRCVWVYLAPVDDSSRLRKVWEPQHSSSCEARPDVRRHVAGCKDAGAKH